MVLLLQAFILIFIEFKKKNGAVALEKEISEAAALFISILVHFTFENELLLEKAYFNKRWLLCMLFILKFKQIS